MRRRAPRDLYLKLLQFAEARRYVQYSTPLHLWDLATPKSAMQTLLETRYARLEKALDTLVESIASYNPSITAADELVSADHSVNSGLSDRMCSDRPCKQHKLICQSPDIMRNTAASLHFAIRAKRSTSRSSRW